MSPREIGGSPVPAVAARTGAAADGGTAAIFSHRYRFGFPLGHPLQACQFRDQLAVVTLAFLTGGFNADQDLPHRVHHTQERRRYLRIQSKLLVPQPAEQVLAYMRHRFQFAETQKAARTLDGVNGTKHAGQRVTVLRIFFQPNQFPVQAVQVLVTLDEKVFYDVTFAHPAALFSVRSD
jgi:hypothetical protein